jgi:predicted deacylase
VDIRGLWPSSYFEARKWFRETMPQSLQAWRGARLEAQPLDTEAELTIDWAFAKASDAPERLLVLITGLHGIEGFVGAVILRLFVDKFLPRLDAASTGLLVVHAMNPWGMHHGRKVNAQNFDLNRNFLIAPQDFDPAFNPDYGRLKTFIGPERPVDPPGRAAARFALGLVKVLRAHGSAVLQRASLLGQYRDPRGMYYGGTGLAQEAQLLLRLLRESVPGHQSVTLLDMHSGYGPRLQMSLVHSPREARSGQELRQRFNYPRVLKADDCDFYAMRGDMVDTLYALAETAWPDIRFYASSFEFGTFGDSTLSLARSLRAMILENQLHHYGARSDAAARWIRREFTALYRPDDSWWWEKAKADARQAFEGILHAEGFLRA